jgi:hypothetical protein
MTSVADALKQRLDEVAWGEHREGAVLAAWAEHAPQAQFATRFIKSGPTDPYDVFVFGRKSLPLCALELKVRRQPLADYGDVMLPLSKHEFAKNLNRYSIPFLSVTLYECGSLVQVNLLNEPCQVKPISRRDRPGMEPVPHAFYKGGSFQVLRAAS